MQSVQGPGMFQVPFPLVVLILIISDIYLALGSIASAFR